MSLPASYPERPKWLIIPPSGSTRPVNGPEIVQLEAFGCTADNWVGVHVPDGFDPSRVRRTHFAGRVVLGRFQGKVERSGILLPSGVYDATLSDCRIGDEARVSNVGLMAGTRVGPGALVADCDEILPHQEGAFGNGVRVGLRAANADRSIPVVADMPFDLIASLARPRPMAETLTALAERAATYAKACRIGVTVIGPGARVTGCRRITGSYISAGCIVSAATTVSETTMLSDDGDAARIGAGAVVRNSLLQWNAVAEDGAFVENSLLSEAATVTRKGIVSSSAIGPNTTIAEGEVSGSVVGPFVGFNHHALLVSACWPEGRGNVGYGANVGSNHTGRAPDQEVHPGEGTFFGLGVNIKMPANYSEAPYTIIATGVDTPPERVSMPFSLIVPGEGGRNTLLPGWGLSHNLYGILRNVWKFSSRNRARRSAFDPDAFRPAVMQLVGGARSALAAAEERSEYTERDLPGLGGNVVPQKALDAGLKAYTDTLRWYALRTFVRRWDAAPPDPASIPYLQQFVSATDPGTLLELFLDAEKKRLAAILTSKGRDDSRGSRTLDDYPEVHTPAADDPVYLWARDRFEEMVARVAALKATV